MLAEELQIYKDTFQLCVLLTNHINAIRWRIWNGIKDKSDICCVRMDKLKIINNNSQFEQEEVNGQLIATWHKSNNYELHQDNNR